MWIKICGLRSPADAEILAQFPPSAIGLNFYSKTERCVTPELAKEISEIVPKSVETVGVFVDHPPAEILEVAEQVGLQHVQLHGDYRPDEIAELRHLSVIWVHRLGREGLAELEQELTELSRNRITPFACLIDARVPGIYGGSGKTVDWPLLSASYQQDRWPPLILAGGLVPGNVRRAIETVHPWGVDVASGVETNQQKNADLVREFLSQSRMA